MIPPSGSRPRWNREKIRAGEFGEDGRLPAESALCDTFKVSRITIRRALEELEHDDLVTRLRGSGTFARSSVPVRPISSSMADYLEYRRGIAEVSDAKLISFDYVAPPPFVRSAMQCRDGETVQMSVRTRSYKSTPFLHLTVYTVGEIRQQRLLNLKELTQPRIYAAHQQLAAGLVNGEVDIALNYKARELQWIKDGAPLAVQFPAEGAIGTTFGAGMSKRAPNPDVAYVYFNAMLDRKAMAQLAGASFYAPANGTADLSPELRPKMDFTQQEREALKFPDYAYVAKNTAVWLDFRRALRRVASTVHVLTTLHEGRRFGLTATAVRSLSVDPPSLLVCVNRTSEAHDPIVASRRICINVLAEGQSAIAARFSGAFGDKGEQRFVEANVVRSRYGRPGAGRCRRGVRLPSVQEHRI